MVQVATATLSKATIANLTRLIVSIVLTIPMKAFDSLETTKVTIIVEMKSKVKPKQTLISKL